jgi:heme/copper-type cytochrome/quinol oxidase subunit 2
VFKFMGVIILTIAVAIVIAGCLSIIYVAFRLVKKSRETYHQFEEDKRASSA